MKERFNDQDYVFHPATLLAEGAGAAALAALLKEKEINKGKRVGVIFSGGNINKDLFKQALG